jgi:hypothetical protein
MSAPDRFYALASVGLNIFFASLAVVVGLYWAVTTGPGNPKFISFAGSGVAVFPCSFMVFGALCLLLIRKFGGASFLITVCALGMFDATLSTFANNTNGFDCWQGVAKGYWHGGFPIPWCTPLAQVPLWLALIFVPLLIVWPKIQAKYLFVWVLFALVVRNYFLPVMDILGVNLNPIPTLDEAVWQVVVAFCVYFGFGPRGKVNSARMKGKVP